MQLESKEKPSAEGLSESDGEDIAQLTPASADRESRVAPSETKSSRHTLELVYDSGADSSPAIESCCCHHSSYPDCADLPGETPPEPESKWSNRKSRRDAGLSLEERKELSTRLPSSSATLRKRYHPIHEPERDHTLWFDSRFEAGNLGRAYRVGPEDYCLLLDSDSGTRHYAQWFYFSVCNGSRKGI